jgi:hypothetical protein
MNMAEQILKIKETDYLLSEKGFCPLINQYMPSLCIGKQIKCPLLDKCNHPKKA